ncbi:hypothetical protein GQR58_026281 [Nymphon striatum]|nr:hypothetical protein GQR58_026281 [Nymphon striatum]
MDTDSNLSLSLLNLTKESLNETPADLLCGKSLLSPMYYFDHLSQIIACCFEENPSGVCCLCLKVIVLEGGRGTCPYASAFVDHIFSINRPVLLSLAMFQPHATWGPWQSNLTSSFL